MPSVWRHRLPACIRSTRPRPFRSACGSNPVSSVGCLHSPGRAKPSPPLRATQRPTVSYSRERRGTRSPGWKRFASLPDPGRRVSGQADRPSVCFITAGPASRGAGCAILHCGGRETQTSSNSASAWMTPETTTSPRDSSLPLACILSQCGDAARKLDKSLQLPRNWLRRNWRRGWDSNPR